MSDTGDHLFLNVVFDVSYTLSTEDLCSYWTTVSFGAELGEYSLCQWALSPCQDRHRLVTQPSNMR